MTTPVILNVFNEFGKIDIFRGIVFLFRNECNKFNNTRARMLDTLRLL